MLKVTFISAVVYLNILLFNGCGDNRGVNSEEIRYENRLDTLFERKIDSAYGKMGAACDSTLQARWEILSDSIINRYHEGNQSPRPVDTGGGSPVAPHGTGGL